MFQNCRALLPYFTLPLTHFIGIVHAEDYKNLHENISSNIETIIVTGSHKSSALLSFAGNIDLISTEDIDSVSAVYPSDILNRATGVHIQANNGMESLPSLRSPVLTGPGAAGAFLFLEDGVATRAAGFANNNGLSEINLAQAKEIEVIRGPASAIYGSNAVHGVINVLTKAPSNKGNISLLFGPNDSYQLQGSLGREMENNGISGSFQAIDDGGYRDESGFNSFKINTKHEYESGADKISTLISGFLLDQDTAGFISSGDNGNGCFSSVKTDSKLYKDRSVMEINCDDDAYREWSSLRITSKWQRILSEDTSFSITPYYRVNQMEFRQHYLPSEAIEENSHYSVGLLSNYFWQIAERLGLIIGIDAEFTEGKLTQTQEKPSTYSWGNARQQGVHFDYEVKATTLAPYIQSDWQVNDALTLTGSLRFDSTQYRYNNLIADGTSKADETSCVDNFDADIPCLYLRPSDRDDRFNKVSSKLGFNYEWIKNTTLFWAWSQGFRAPQTTDLYRLQKQQAIGEIDSEEINSSEIGIRGVNNQLHYEAVIYTMTKNNFFFRDDDGLNVTDGKTSHKGVELGVKYDLNDVLKLSVNYSYGNHKYEFNRESSGVFKGNEIDTAPKQLANTRLSWLPSANTKLELEWLYMGHYYLDPANKHKYNGHSLWQLRGAMQFDNNIDIFARIENLMDEKYASRADYAFGSYRFFGGQPRTLHLGVNVNF